MAARLVPGRRASATATRISRPTVITFGVVRAVLTHPSIWGEALRTVKRMRPVHGDLLPSSEYISFRLHTNAGTDERPSADDVVRFLKWTGSQRKVLG
jgi:hypothetical protein